MAIYVLSVISLIAIFRTKVVKHIFTVSFLLITVLPLVFIDYQNTYSTIENRVFAAFPSLSDPDIFRQIDNYVNDRFGFKRYFVYANSLCNSAILRDKKNNRALIGKDGWLFYIDKDDGDNLADFQKTNLFDANATEQFVTQIEERATWCEENGIQFIFMVAPNKHNIYPEYYPFERPDGITRMDQVVAAMPPELLDRMIFPRDYLLAKKGEHDYPLYYETDTHWNKQGAFYAHELLRMKIQAYFPAIKFPDIAYSTSVSADSGGDIVPMLGFTSYGITEIAIEPENGWPSYYAYIKQEENKGRLERIITEHGDQTLPRAIVFRDSFFTALEPFNSTLFSSAEYIWKQFGKTDKEYILNNKPDIIIWEIVERYAGMVLQNKF
jgi:hypothetical protein